MFSSGILTALHDFYVHGVRGRFREILLSQETVISIVLGAGFALWGNLFFPESSKLVDISLGYLAYAAIALGFCVGGVTIALTLPDRDFVVKLAGLRIAKKSGDALSGLFFVFCWTAVVHWLSVVLVLFVLAIDGHSDINIFSKTTISGRSMVGISIAICTYALMQFMITVLTIWQVGCTYIRNLQSK